MGVPNIDDNSEKILLKWMLWGYPHSRKPPNFIAHLGCIPEVPSPCSQIGQAGPGPDSTPAMGHEWIWVC